jgi:hypothetical protein
MGGDEGRASVGEAVEMERKKDGTPRLRGEGSYGASVGEMQTKQA